jgi:4'-phosphopantetheinyl transferase
VTPQLGPGEVAVWRLDRRAPRPIETVAARYLGAAPESLVLVRSETGKPAVAGSPFAVSLAHSGDVTLVAVSSDADVGIDVERLRPEIAGWSLVEQALTENEQAPLTQTPTAERPEAFLAIWTRKEALLKAAGVGLALDPSLIELDGSTVVSVPSALGSPSEWTLRDVVVPGYAAAVALRGTLARLELVDGRAAAQLERQ